MGVVFSTSGSFTEAQKTLSGQALKAIFKMNKHLYKFTSISVSHRIELFDCENNIRVKNWCSLLKQLLCTLGFYEVWLFQEVGNASVFLSK